MFLLGGYYTTLIKPGLRLVSLNTVYYYTNDKLTANLSDPANQFSWFDNVMTSAANSKEKVCSNKVIEFFPTTFCLNKNNELIKIILV